MYEKSCLEAFLSIKNIYKDWKNLNKKITTYSIKIKNRLVR